MFPNKPNLSVTIPSSTMMLKMVVELTRYMATLNQFSPSASQKIGLAIDEAVTNVIKHSYQNKKNKEIKIDFFCGYEGMKITLSFLGIPPDLEEREVDVNQMVKEKRRGGLGVELMRKIMDSVHYRTINNVNYCEMVKWKT